MPRATGLTGSGKGACRQSNHHSSFSRCVRLLKSLNYNISHESGAVVTYQTPMKLVLVNTLVEWPALHVVRHSGPERLVNIPLQ